MKPLSNKNKNEMSVKNRQTGAVLVTSLVFMVIISLLATTSMNTSKLEEKMASGFQEYERAFMASELGLERAMADDDAFSLGNIVDDQGTSSTDDDVYTYDKTESSIGGYGAGADYKSEYIQYTTPSRDSGWDAANYRFYHFDMQSACTTESGASVTLHAGAYQIGPR